MATVFPIDPFATKNLLTIPDLNADAPSLWPGFSLDPDLKAQHLALEDHVEAQLLDLRLDDLPSSADVSLENLEVSDEQTSDEDKENIWALDTALQPGKKNVLRSWTHFLSPDHEGPPFTYLIEAPTAVFDARLQTLEPSESSPPRRAKPSLLLNALFDMGLGRSTAFFAWNIDEQIFTPLVTDYSLSGLSDQTLQYSIGRLKSIGSVSCRLVTFGQAMIKQEPMRITFVTALLAAFNAVESHVEGQRYQNTSLAHLHELFERPSVLINALDRLRHIADQSSTQQLASAIARESDCISRENPEMSGILRALYARSIQPILDQLMDEIGLARPDNLRGASITLQPMTGLFSDSTVEILSSVKASLRTLGDSDFPFLAHSAEQRLRLQAQFTWDEIVDALAEAEEHEEINKHCLTSQSTAKSTRVAFVHGQLQHINDNVSSEPFEARFDVFGIPEHPPLQACEDPLVNEIKAMLSEEGNSTVIHGLTCEQATELSVLPLLTAQHRLLSYSVVRLLFQTHDLISHLSILRRFQLMGDDFFSSQLATALFDMNQLSGEGKRKGNAKIGLRIQDRDTWPPTSSELRLVLIDILSESLSRGVNNDTNDSISFAIRDLSDEELERCRNINSIFALDFLRLYYKASATVLEHVITSQTLDTYDQIFRHLLRVLRMKELTKSLLQHFCVRNRKAFATNNVNQTHKFLLECHHFTSTLASYSQDTAIELPWLAFNSTLQETQSRLQRNDYDGTLAAAISPESLRARHEATLDAILRALLLNKRHVKILEVLYDLFGIILKLLPFLSSTVGDKIRDTDTVSLRKDFRNKMKSFVDALVPATTSSTSSGGMHGSSTDGNPPGLNGSSGWDSLDALRIRLDYNGFYGSPQGDQMFDDVNDLTMIS